MTHPLDSDSVARYLADNSRFFEEHAELLSQIRLSSALGGRTVSLQERQMEVVREKMKALELRLADLMRIGQENDAITGKFQQWSRSLLMARNDVDLPHVLVNGLQMIFDVPQATLRLWGVAAAFSHTWFAAEVSEDSQIFSRSLTAPFCGSNQDFEAASWLEDAASVQSIAMLPLRAPGTSTAFGLLVLGSPDAARFTADMGTDFLVKISDTASAAVTCLLD
ncbi:MAG: DUF484 family protein [Herminiimonas sp.]|nr:DUF484 family protein [Herminiimonas sp.]